MLRPGTGLRGSDSHKYGDPNIPGLVNTGIKPDDILFFMDAEHGIGPNIGSGATFTRASKAYVLDGASKYRELANDVPRDFQAGFDLVQNRFRQTVALAVAHTNIILHSNDFTDAVWTKNAEITLTARAGIFEQEDGTLVNGFRADNAGGAGFRNIQQDLGTLSSGPETLSVILRNIGAVDTRIGIRDNTVAGWVVSADLEWSTLSITIVSSNVGSDVRVGAEDLGGGFVRFSVTGTPANSGNTRSIWIYPTGTSDNTDSVEIYHAQHVLEPFPGVPIVTGASAATQEVERLRYDSGPPEAMIVYTSWIEQGVAKLGDQRRLWQIGQGTEGGNPRFMLIFNVPDQYRALMVNEGGGSTNSLLTLNTPIGSLVETVTILRPNAVTIVGVRINGGPVSVGDQDASVSFPADNWPHLDLNSTGANRDGLAGFLSVKIVKEAAPENGATLDAALMDEMRDLEFDIANTQVYWSEGDVPKQSRRARVSWASGEVPVSGRAARVFFAEGDIPTLDRAARVLFAEGDIPVLTGASFGALVGESKLLAELTQAPLILSLAGGKEVAGQSIFEATQGDTRPIRALLKDEDGNLPDLSGATVTFLFGDADGDQIFTGSATGFASVQTDADGDQYNVEYGFAATDLDRAVGSYRAQFKVVLADGTVLHFPGGGDFIKIKLGRAIS